MAMSPGMELTAAQNAAKTISNLAANSPQALKQRDSKIFNELKSVMPPRSNLSDSGTIGPHVPYENSYEFSFNSKYYDRDQAISEYRGSKLQKDISNIASKNGFGIRGTWFSPSGSDYVTIRVMLQKKK